MGPRQAKSPAKMIATSMIGPNEKPLSRWKSLGVSQRDPCRRWPPSRPRDSPMGSRAAGTTTRAGRQRSAFPAVSGARPPPCRGRAPRRFAFVGPPVDEVERRDSGPDVEDRAGRRRQCEGPEARDSADVADQKWMGSPGSVSEPPALATATMKSGTRWARYSRWRLVQSSGRIISMLAPVVPTKLASTDPSSTRATFVAGLASTSPVSCTPPEVT